MKNALELNLSQMLVRFRRDVLDLAPKYVVILAGIEGRK